MVKKLVFDLDNTLIMWKSEYVSALEETMKEFNIESIKLYAIDNIIETLEKKYEIISKDILLKDINEQCNLNLNMDFINLLFEKQKLLAFKDNELIETIKYLNSKYELVVLTNYFTDVQKGRLETAGILKYFKEVFGGDEVKLKPSKEAFMKAIYPNNIDECIMIGDSLEFDIKGALNIELEAIAFDYKNQIPDSKDYIKIKKISDLMKIL